MHIVHIVTQDQQQDARPLQCSRLLVLAIDHSQSAYAAFKYLLLNLYRPQEDQLLLVHVQPFHVVSEVASSSNITVPLYSKGLVLQHSKQVARRFLQLATQFKVPNVKIDIVLKDGRVGPALCDYLSTVQKEQKWSNVSLVLGASSSKSSGLTSLLSMRTSDFCASKAPTSVIVVRSEDVHTENDAENDIFFSLDSSDGGIEAA